MKKRATPIDQSPAAELEAALLDRARREAAAAEMHLHHAEMLISSAFERQPALAHGAHSPHMTLLLSTLWPALAAHLTTILEMDWKDGHHLRNFIEAKVAVQVAERMQRLTGD